MIYGKFELELNSDYNYHKGTIVKIDGVRYEFVQEIVDAIAPILIKERNLIKKELEEND